MAFVAATVLKRASTILQDDDAVRWTPPELCAYLNDGLIELASIKPNAKTATVTLSLVAGTRQTLPAIYTMLCDVTRNVAGKAIRRLLNRTLMDAQIPGWQTTEVLPFAAQVSNVIRDLLDPRSFYVVPGNNGAGQVEAIVGQIPAPVPLPVNSMDMDAYTTPVDVPDIYQNALVDFVLYRAFSKDSGNPGAAQRAVAHFQQFTNAVNGFAASEAAMSRIARGAPAPAG